MMFLQPPHIDGVMILSEIEIPVIKAKLLDIKLNFVPTELEPLITTFRLTSEYNKANIGNEINGDTVEYLTNRI